ncbi:MAG TPA: alpha/beta hydrolase [Candidatus Limnocylindria bacterium]|jgi:pimeloyl-ACP methyl ester carboxylesterase
MTNFVLVHSPHGGAYTWQPVETLLRERGHHVATPTFRSTRTGPHYWVRNMNAILRMVQRPNAILVGHSGAGPLLAHVARWSEGSSCVYVDAGFRSRKISSLTDALPLTERGAGLVPAWANDTDLAELLPDAATRANLIGSMTPMPREYFGEEIPYREPPDGSAYILLSPPYAEPAAEARAKGWPVRELAGQNHYLMLAQPEQVADSILAALPS